MEDSQASLPPGMKEETLKLALETVREKFANSRLSGDDATDDMELEMDMPEELSSEHKAWLVMRLEAELTNLHAVTVSDAAEDDSSDKREQFSIQDIAGILDISESHAIRHDIPHCNKARSRTSERHEELLADELVCDRTNCRTCTSQVYSLADCVALGADYEELSVVDLKARLHVTTRQIFANFDFIHACKQDVMRKTSEMSLPDLSRALSNAFAQSLSESTYKQALNREKKPADCRKDQEYSVLIPMMLHHTNSVAEFATKVFQARATQHPIDFLEHDNAQVQLGWTELFVPVISAECCVKISAENSYAIVCLPFDPEALHHERVFSATRADLILRAQQLIYAGLRKFTEELLAQNGAYVNLPTHVSPLQQTPVASLLQKLNSNILPRMDDLIQPNKRYLPKFGGSGREFVAEMQRFEKWLLDSTHMGKIAAGDELTLAVIRATTAKARKLTVLEALRASLRSLRTTAKEHLEGDVCRSVFLEKWEKVEDAVTILCAEACKNILQYVCGLANIIQLLLSHDMEWQDLIHCSEGHHHEIDSAGVGKEVKPTMLWLLCAGWTMPEKARVVRSLLRQPRSDIPDWYRRETLLTFDVALEIYNMLEGIQPCIINESDVFFYDECMEPSIRAPTSKCLVQKYLHMRDNQADDVVQNLWDAYFQGLEEAWSILELDIEARQTLRQALGMPVRRVQELNTPKRTDPAREDCSSESGCDANGAESSVSKLDQILRQARCGNLGALAEPVAVRHDTPKIPNSGGPMTYKSKVRAVDSRIDASANDLFGRDLSSIKTGRPSQFEEAVVRDKQPKRRNRAAPAETTPLEQTVTIQPPPVLPSKTKLIFKDAALYEMWRQIFPLPGSTTTRSPIKWEDLCRLLRSEPLHFDLVTARGVAFKWKRAPRDGHANFEMGMHKPHGVNPRIEKNLLKHIQKNLSECTGLRAEDFGLEGEEN